MFRVWFVLEALFFLKRVTSTIHGAIIKERSEFIQQTTLRNCALTPEKSPRRRKLIGTRCFAVCYEERACQLLKFYMSHDLKKGPFATLIIESSQIFFFKKTFLTRNAFCRSHRDRHLILVNT